MRFDLHTLRLFVSTVDAANIAAAARKHAIAASAVSKRITDMEAGLGTALLYRRPRGVEPTPAGTALALHARKLLALLDRMESELSEFADGAKGHVRIAANTSAVTQFLPDEMAAFMRDNPDVRVELIEDRSEALLQMVRDGLADVAIFSGTIEAGDLVVLPYRADVLTVITPPGHVLADREEVSFIETLAFDHVGLQHGTSLLTQLQAEADDLDRELRLRVQVASFDGLRRMVAAGLGIGILPDGAVRPYLDGSLIAVPLSDPWAGRRLNLAVRDAAALTKTAKAMVTHLTSDRNGA